MSQQLAQLQEATNQTTLQVVADADDRLAIQCRS
jgi:hypothetical protein